MCDALPKCVAHQPGDTYHEEPCYSAYPACSASGCLRIQSGRPNHLGACKNQCDTLAAAYFNASHCPNTLEITNTPTPRPTDTLGATPTEAIPHVTEGLPPEGQEPIDVGSMENLIVAAEYYNSLPPVIPNDQTAFFGTLEQPDLSEVKISCYQNGKMACAPIFTAQLNGEDYAYIQVGTEDGPKNLLLYLGYPLAEAYPGTKEAQIEMLRSGLYNIYVSERIKTTAYDNPLAIKLTVGLNDALPPKFQHLNEGKIDPELEISPVWGMIKGN